MQHGRYIAHKFESGWEVEVIKAFDDSVGDYEADPNVMLEDVPQDIVIKTLKVWCACVPVLVFACVCVFVRARDVDMCS